jgi:hypothetical protein
MSTDGYDWNDGDTVLQEQPRTAVFLNADGAVLIRQQSWPEEDDVVILQPQNAIRFVLAVLAAAGHDDIELIRSLGGCGYQDVELPSDPRRQRERQEDSGFIDAVRTERPDLDVDKALADFDQKMAPKDPTASQRQRRRREKQRQRDGVTEAVTERDADRDGVTAPLIPEFDLQNGGQKSALAN